jgi:FkbM family methyltransferase
MPAPLVKLKGPRRKVKVSLRSVLLALLVAISLVLVAASSCLVTNKHEQPPMIDVQQQHRTMRSAAAAAAAAADEHHVDSIRTPDGQIDSSSSSQQSVKAAILPKPGYEQYRIQPIDCVKLRRQVNSGGIVVDNKPLKDPNQGQSYMVRNVTQQFAISLHPKAFDFTRWGIVEYGQYYERKLTEIFEQILSSSRKSHRVLDIGGNVGWFALLSRKLGHPVDTFEPNLLNVLRLCESLEENKWDGDDTGDGVDIFPYGVYNETTTLKFAQVEGNPGQGSFGKFGQPSQVYTIDDFARERKWLESGSDVKIAILKIDIEGREPQALSGAKALLKSKVVQNVFMEISGQLEQLYIPTIRILLDAGFEIVKYGRFMGPNKEWPYPPNQTTHEIIMQFVKEYGGNGGKQLNFWWKLVE